MSRFTFRLERVLMVRETIETRRQLELAEAERALEAAEAEVARIEAIIGSEQRIMRDHSSGRLSVTRFQTAHAYLSRLRSELALALVAVDEEKENVEACRERLMQAMKDRKVLEKLEENERRQHRLHTDRREQKEMDEIAQRWTEHGEVDFSHRHSHRVIGRIGSHDAIDGAH